MCMRQKKLSALYHRTHLTRDAFDTVIRAQFQKEDFSACKEYAMESQDIDVLGHVIGPFKTRVINAAKKVCSSTNER